jgi:hypothetical protein
MYAVSVPDAIARIPESVWHALDDYPDEGEAQIAETTAHGRRLIVRPHPPRRAPKPRGGLDILVHLMLPADVALFDPAPLVSLPPRTVHVGASRLAG